MRTGRSRPRRRQLRSWAAASSRGCHSSGGSAAKLVRQGAQPIARGGRSQSPASRPRQSARAEAARCQHAPVLNGFGHVFLRIDRGSTGTQPATRRFARARRCPRHGRREPRFGNLCKRQHQERTLRPKRDPRNSSTNTVVAPHALVISRSGRPLPPCCRRLRAGCHDPPIARPPAVRLVAEVGQDDDVIDLADRPQRLERAWDTSGDALAAEETFGSATPGRRTVSPSQQRQRVGKLPLSNRNERRAPRRASWRVRDFASASSQSVTSSGRLTARSRGERRQAPPLDPEFSATATRSVSCPQELQ